MNQQNYPSLSIGVTTLPSSDAAHSLAKSLVSEKLAACAQIDGPIHSYYSWNNSLQSSQEFRLTLKFPPHLLSNLSTRLLQLHPYDTPQWLTFNASCPSSNYFSWTLNTTSPPPPH